MTKLRYWPPKNTNLFRKVVHADATRSHFSLVPWSVGRDYQISSSRLNYHVCDLVTTRLFAAEINAGFQQICISVVETFGWGVFHFGTDPKLDRVNKTTGTTWTYPNLDQMFNCRHSLVSFPTSWVNGHRTKGLNMIFHMKPARCSGWGYSS